MDIKTTEEIVSYGLGTQVASQLSFFPGFSFEALLEGIKDGAAGKLRLPHEQIAQAFKDINEKLKKEQEELARAVQAESEKYLKANAAKEGVKVTSSGLQYEVLAEGSGKIPSSKDKVKVHYHGTFTDGRVFDSSVERGEPAVFGVTQVIKGWTEALQLMKVGSKYRLTIPSDLAYGDSGAGTIPPKAALIFDVELLDIL
ncbi:FKBP-type peptidyl-prolyl cis-trans isomerase [Succinimonas amylolytica]|uniref:FKBP-type peptidyl-prolyl cis-trans isomerase n=1 Tax=Succinimonas amylolytica TaxID=83769 RepID=UPI000367180D|nr:FKBP-type peptidyl-prolyl cis-trans isomerase [Succinimonas amylolytica]